MADKRLLSQRVVFFVSFFIFFLGCSQYGDPKPDARGQSNRTDKVWQYCRNDTVFKSHDLQTPILFAHRGGSNEAPESTEKAFINALVNARADVLEIDVELTKDVKIVVWHGPDLDNVYIVGQNNTNPQNRPADKNDIYDFSWAELAGSVWVADSGKPLHNVLDDKNGRELLLLSDFLSNYRAIPLNIEIKSSFNKKLSGQNGLPDNIAQFIRVLDAGRYNRNIVVASSSHSIIKEFRKQSGERYVTNLTAWEQFKLIFSHPDLNNRALETGYHWTLSSGHIVKKVRRLGGSTYVFLTDFPPFPALDKNPAEKEDQIMKILDKGVDGIMTDSPTKVRTIINSWKHSRCSN